ncbi:DUF7144 family membrane protein [Actinomadura macrotermitis]|uniref:DUF7144 domain-containing protein n=1 Tax=Actinomadura macrotermitis TaxID=2585200 RepID=A0A7K0BM16_9ACTN|nr:hypothetical protein [Actinomadura macrotermitis]MQY02116.1 hypothetical protein [Actinomadura macrotermitis]
MSERTTARRQETESSIEPEPAGGWAVGFAIFGGVMMVLIGTFQALEGVAAIAHDHFYLVTRDYVYDLDTTTWGWIHLVLGALVAVAGFFVFSGRGWARAVGVVCVAANAVSQFLFIPYYPVWGLVMIALDVAVVWALCVYGQRTAERAGY